MAYPTAFAIPMTEYGSSGCISKVYRHAIKHGKYVKQGVGRGHHCHVVPQPGSSKGGIVGGPARPRAVRSIVYNHLANDQKVGHVGHVGHD